MEITEVRIKLIGDADDRLQAFCSITFDDCFVVRDLKIIDGSNGPFVAMPSRKLTLHCPQCGGKNHLRAAYCNQCGLRMKDDRAIRDDEGRVKLHADIAHPINSECREMIQQRVIGEYEEELARAGQPGYQSRYDEGYDSGHSTVPPPKGDVQTVADTTSESKVEPPQDVVQGPHSPSGEDSEAIPQKPDEHEGEDFGSGIF